MISLLNVSLLNDVNCKIKVTEKGRICGGGRDRSRKTWGNSCLLLALGCAGGKDHL